MAEGGKFRGYEIEMMRGGYYVFSDTRDPVEVTWKARPCGHCGKHNTPEGHDPCFGTIPGALNACCGHGHTPSAYIQFKDYDIRGQAVLDFMAELQRVSDGG